MELQILWFILWGVLWAVYFMLDGFVVGLQMISPVIAKTDTEKRILINTVGPVWDGNEVWLITAGGATFAAFPGTYALMFSYLYTALLLLLFALIIRGVSFEFRGKVDSPLWKGSWDKAIVITGFLIALLFGVAFGNIFQGLPMDGAGYHGTFFSLLNPYGLLTGVLFLALFAMHGALYVSVKTKGELCARAEKWANIFWFAVLVLAVAFLAYSKIGTKLLDNYFQVPLLLIIPLIAVAALVAIKVFMSRNSWYKAFTASCVTVLFIVFTGVAGLFPNLIPSSIDPAWSLTIFNTSSSQYTLKIMTVVALIFVPIVICYKIWVYRIFRARVTEDDVNTPEAY
ncbi:MAG: cytochrome d ubiquinol oxidase subunit II [Syntrophobacterales bacterium]|jgi:cytochrome d ubiquinol oxidase subunit II|nr:cytochrome d ubiquinol oxidase subunit II [Syntrophobacterales bacterium]